MDPDFIDPPLGRSVTTREVAELTRKVDESDRLANPRSLADWLPERPYTSDDDYLRKLEKYNNDLDKIQADIAGYDTMLIVGGSGPIVDMANNARVHDLILAFLKSGKPVAAECYGVACLAFARNWEDRKSIIWGKHVTGHCKEYDYKDGTGFLRHRLQHGPAAVPAGVHPARRHRPGRPLPRQLRPRALGHRRLPVHHRSVHSGLVPDRREDRRGPGERPHPVRLVSREDNGKNDDSEDHVGSRPGKVALCEQLQADGMTHVFGNPGTVEQGLLDELELYGGFEYFLTLQETVAAGIADGYARATKKPTLLQLHSGVGLGNGIGMLYQAMRGHAPIVCIAGESGVRYEAMDAQMASDLVAMARPVTKWAGRVTEPSSLLRTFRRAVKIAMTPPHGTGFPVPAHGHPGRTQ